MFGSARCETLLSPFQIGQVHLKNRIVKAPQASGNATGDGAPTDGAFAYYGALAKGGVGLIIVEGAAVDYPLGVVGWPRLGIHDDAFVPRYAALVNHIHSLGAKAFIEIQHAGPSHPQSMSGLQPVAPSVLDRATQPVPTFDLARALTLEEITDVQQRYVNAAVRAKAAGFDGVDLHGAHRYLINAFLSPAWNKRTDEYGRQDLSSRARFAVEIIRAVRNAVGSEFPVGIRYNVAEWGLQDGITADEGVRFGELFQAAGADFLDVSGYGYRNFLWGYWGEQLRALEPGSEVKPWLRTIEDPGFIISQAASVKKAVSIPVISGSRVDPRVADRDIKNGSVDLVFFARRLIADPSMPAKIAARRWDDIAPCTACLECWESTTTLHTAVRCRINAASGRELEFEMAPAETRKRVMVVGGGPAGMEAARIAALRGHEVVLYEKERHLGGQLPLAAVIKGLEVEDLGAITRYLKTQLVGLGVTLRLGSEVDASVIEEVRPDVVILAVGGVPVTPSVPGIDNKIVIPAARLHRQARIALRFMDPGYLRWLTKLWMPIGKRIVVLGGSIQGLELAEFLVKRGRTVTVVETSGRAGGEMVMILAERLLRWLEKKGVTVHVDAKYEEITDRGLTITNSAGEKQTLEADNILVALPLAPTAALQQALQGSSAEVYSVGDCREPHRIIHAIHDGSRVGRMI